MHGFDDLFVEILVHRIVFIDILTKILLIMSTERKEQQKNIIA